VTIADVRPLLLFVALYAPDANAWGLQTHLFFAQYALALVPLADPELRAAAARWPRLVLAGACLPDLAIVGRFILRTPTFRRAHLWGTLRRIATAARNDHERALALGYATHLLSDVIAHNHFVPEHEARIGRGAMIAHLFSEWAMDEHVAADPQPADVLEEASWRAAEFIALGFRCSEIFARRAIGILAGGDRMLRRSRAPALCKRLIGRKRLPRFDSYLTRTTGQLATLEAAVFGHYEDWCGSDPEGSSGDDGADRRAGEHIARIMQAEDYTRGGGE
jgi:hypothetical protein